MKVKLKPTAANQDNVRGWLRRDIEYTVLSIETVGNEEAYRMITGDDATPALFEASLFDVTDESIPDLWVKVPQEDGWADQQMPSAWSADGFWEAFFDSDSAARKSYDLGVAELTAAE